MQVVQAIIYEVLSASTSPGTNALALGAKLDDGSIALGAALVCNKLYANEDEVPQPVPDSPFTPLGMSSEALVTSSTKGYSDSDSESDARRRARYARSGQKNHSATGET